MADNSTLSPPNALGLAWLFGTIAFNAIGKRAATTYLRYGSEAQSEPQGSTSH
ncbi:hypothetical protein DM02DRAFT_678167 [Periconia macrospinosa]|uniref:Uncharacterized protein n=1 Tax=Periconia macrospinosa TaxID=97972 RepID=A0A2V1CZR0_9PLEO|nr:hypothetical protein DM02DRAFT_678167 [Periconia macrospinosa]